MHPATIVEPMDKSKRVTISELASMLGRRGGPARAKALTKARRKAIARKAARTRWAKVRRRPR
jgi:hypothetical protein